MKHEIQKEEYKMPPFHFTLICESVKTKASEARDKI